MPRPLIRRKGKVELTSNDHRPLTVRSSVNVEERLRQTRSSQYLDQLSQLDVGEKVVHQAKMDEIIDAVKNEFSDLPDPSLPLGIVAKCYLGHPYEVHLIDFEKNLITHYKTSEPLPDPLEGARRIAQHPSYAYIEVYTDCMRAIDQNGRVAVVK